MRFVLAMVLLAGCSEKVNVSVNCVTAADGVTCDVQQTAGKTEVETCWDFAVTCANGAVVKAPRTCAKVKDGGTTKATIPADKLTDREKCDGDKPPTAKITNLTIDGKPSEN